MQEKSSQISPIAQQQLHRDLPNPHHPLFRVQGRRITVDQLTTDKLPDDPLRDP